MNKFSRIIIVGFSALLLSINSLQAKVLLLKQWHLLPSVSTLNIEESFTLPQAENQLDLYKKLKEFADKNKNALVLYEGCEGVIDDTFTQSFHGWDSKKLQDLNKTPSQYSKILTHLGLKLEVEYKDRLDNQCGDNMNLVKLHQLAFSDFKAYIGYLQRLGESKDDPEKFAAYAESMAGETLLVVDPYLFALQSAKNTFLKVKYFLRTRNLSFIKQILANPTREIAVVIGGLHVEDFSEQLKQYGVEHQIYTPKGYPKEDGELLNNFENMLFKK